MLIYRRKGACPNVFFIIIPARTPLQQIASYPLCRQPVPFEAARQPRWRLASYPVCKINPIRADEKRHTKKRGADTAPLILLDATSIYYLTTTTF